MWVCVCVCVCVNICACRDNEVPFGHGYLEPTGQTIKLYMSMKPTEVTMGGSRGISDLNVFPTELEIVGSCSVCLLFMCTKKSSQPSTLKARESREC